MKLLLKIIISVFCLLLVDACALNVTNEFVQVVDGNFVRNGSAYRYVGANYWYGANLAADTVGGDRVRLLKELDFLKAHGIDNLRILAAAEGPDNQSFRVTPTAIKAPGVFSPKMLEGLDFLLNEMKKRNMLAVLYLTNNWEWSGGMAQYLNWNGYGEYVNPNLEKFSWSDFSEYQKQFYSCETCIEQLNQFIKAIVNRTNSMNGIAYKNDPTIMAWELANEPRPMDIDNFEPFKTWIKSTANYIKLMDKNHLVTTGNEGEQGCSRSMDLYKEIHSYKSIDYLTFHIWVKNWQWFDCHNPEESFDSAKVKVQKYFDDHIAAAQELNKPLVLEEFGMARDYEEFAPGTPTSYRDKYYQFIFEQIEKSKLQNTPLAGSNFWAFGGYAAPIENQAYWKAGTPYTGDPPQEEQGLNSVFASDTSTLTLIRKYNLILQ